MCFKIWVTSTFFVIHFCNLILNYQVRQYKEPIKIKRTTPHIKLKVTVSTKFGWKITYLFQSFASIGSSKECYFATTMTKCYFNFYVPITMISIHSWHWKLLHGWQLFVRVIKVRYCNKNWMRCIFKGDVE